MKSILIPILAKVGGMYQHIDNVEVQYFVNKDGKITFINDERYLLSDGLILHACERDIKNLSI